MSMCDYRLPGGTVVRTNNHPYESHEVQKLAVTREEAAVMLSICSKTLDRLVSDGSIRSIKVCRRRIFFVEDLYYWLRKNSSGQTAATSSDEAVLPLTVTRQQAANLLSLGVRLFDQIVGSGQIPKIQITRKLIFRTSDLVEWLQKQPAVCVFDKV